MEMETEDGLNEETTVFEPAEMDPSKVVVHLTPVTTILPRFERDWPVAVSIEEGRIVTLLDDLLMTSSWYLEKSLLLIGSVLVIRNVFSIAYVPSESMIPTLQRGEAVIVEYITPRFNPDRCRIGDVVFFQPPPALRAYVARASRTPLRSRDLFVKRIAACPGDAVDVFPSGDVEVNGRRVPRDKEVAINIDERHDRIERDEVFVLGDNPSRSIDSRFWGPLPKANVVGRPLLRLWNILTRSVHVEFLR